MQTVFYIVSLYYQVWHPSRHTWHDTYGGKDAKREMLIWYVWKWQIPPVVCRNVKARTNSELIELHFVSLSKAWYTHTVPDNIQHNIWINPQLEIAPSTYSPVWVTSVKNYGGQLILKKWRTLQNIIFVSHFNFNVPPHLEPVVLELKTTDSETIDRQTNTQFVLTIRK